MPNSLQAAPASFLSAIKERAARELEKTPLPSSSKESWRKIRVDSRADLSPFSSKNSISKVSLENEDKNFQLLSFAEAEKKDELKKIVERHLKESLDKALEEQDYFILQNLAEEKHSLLLVSDTYKGEEKAKTQKEAKTQTLRIKHHLQSGNSLIHQLLVYVPDNTQLCLIEEFGEFFKDGNTQRAAVYWNTLTRAYIGRNSKLYYLTLRNYEEEDYHFQRFFGEQKRDSHLLYSLAHCGGGLGKGFVETRLLESNASFRGLGIYAGSNKNFYDMEMLAEHCEARTRSSILYKAVAREEAHSVFDGKLKIRPQVKNVNSRQTNHNLLLDPQARAESMPRLTVKAEDVSCEHAATVGVLDPDALFYLLSRGLGIKEARALMIEGFLNETMREFPLKEEKEREDLLYIFKKKLAMF